MSGDNRSEKLDENLREVLLRRAATLDASVGTTDSVDELRNAAMEAGISRQAFDRALQELRSDSEDALVVDSKLPKQLSILSKLGRFMNSKWSIAIIRNAAALLSTWLIAYAATNSASGLGLDWTMQKFLQSTGLASGALLSYHLRARWSYLLATGMSLAVFAEYILDIMAGQPAVRGMWPHLYLIVTGLLIAMSITSTGRRPPLNELLADSDEKLKPENSMLCERLNAQKV